MLAAALAAGTAGCGRSRAGALPAKPQTVDVAMQEYRFLYDAPDAAGRIVFRVHNEGRLRHDLVLVYLEEGLPPLDEQLRGSDRRIVATIASLPARAPGQQGTFAVDLQPGRYGMICFVTDPDGRQHAQKGMNSEFRVS